MCGVLHKSCSVLEVVVIKYAIVVANFCICAFSIYTRKKNQVTPKLAENTRKLHIALCLDL